MTKQKIQVYAFYALLAGLFLYSFDYMMKKDAENMCRHSDYEWCK